MYDNKSVLLELIEADAWGDYAPLITELKATPYWDIFYDALLRLKRDALYLSPVHGVGHIERTLLHGAFCAMSDFLSEADASLLMDMCSYHDTGRISDWLDNTHGFRSALKLEKLSGRSGEDLLIMKVGVEVHSLSDNALAEITEKYAPADRQRAKRLAELLKDADGLDRVRIKDLNVKFLRRQSSRSRAAFAQYLFDSYTQLSGESAADELKDGFEVSTVLAVKDFLAKSLTEGLVCGQAMILSLGNLCGVIINAQLLDACAGLEGCRCGLLDAALLFIGVYFSKNGIDKDEIRKLCIEYTELFITQYSSDSCPELKKAVGGTHTCESLAVDASLFAFKFIKEKQLKYK